jgi:hypothetical protein
MAVTVYSLKTWLTGAEMSDASKDASYSEVRFTDIVLAFQTTSELQSAGVSNLSIHLVKEVTRDTRNKSEQVTLVYHEGMS